MKVTLIFALAIAGLFSDFRAVAQHREDYRVTEQKLQELSKTVRALEEKINRITKDTATKEVMPRERDQKYFSDDMRSLRQMLSDEIARWIHDVRDQTLPQPTFKKLEVPGHWVMGITKLWIKDIQEAMSTYNSACELWSGRLRQLSGQTFDHFTCGAPQNIAQAKQSGFCEFASEGTLTLKIPADWNVSTISGGAVLGAKNDLDLDAQRSWQENCFQWMQAQVNAYGSRLVAASCGVPANVVPPTYPDRPWRGPFLFSSTGKLYLKDN
ncbi:MAG: hypothetical protein HY537_00070 [Deltaproteobacteria bacterium]|nr:hypothetical protein [Deltaproteobacteria bacterium]